MSKVDRQKIFDKYGGLCGYTGKPLDDKWQIDHIEPQYYFRLGIAKGDKNDVNNLLPAIRIINHYKRGQTLFEFRKSLSTLHLRLKKLPINPKVKKSIRHKEYLLEVAGLFGVTTEKPFEGKFYFELINPSHPI